MSDSTQKSNGNTAGAVILYHLERDVARLDREQQSQREDIKEVKATMNEIRITVASMRATLAVFATLGALVGGGLVNLISNLVTR